MNRFGMPRICARIDGGQEEGEDIDPQRKSRNATNGSAARRHGDSTTAEINAEELADSIGAAKRERYAALERGSDPS